MLAVPDPSVTSQTMSWLNAMGCIGNSFSHLILALSQSLLSWGADVSIQSLSDASLQACTLMTRDLGRLKSTLTSTR